MSIAEPPPTTPTGAILPDGETRRLEWIALEQIAVAEGFNARSDGWQAEEAFTDLVDSIEEHGVLQPLLVREHLGAGVYTVVAGHRRLAAAKRAGLQRVPALVGEHDADPKAAAAAALVENVQRENLAPVDEARAIETLISEHELRQVDVAKLMGKSERWVRERLRILKLPDVAQQAIAAGEIPTAGVRNLELIAEQAPRAAELVVEAIREGADVTPAELVNHPGSALQWALEGADRDNHEPDPLVEVRSGSFGSGIHLDALPIPAEPRDALVERLKASDKRHPNLSRSGRPWLQLPDDAAERARVAGKLLHLEGKGYGGQTEISNYIADPDLLLELATEAVEKREAEAEQAVADAAKKPKAKAPKDPHAEEAERRKAWEKAEEAIHTAARPHAIAHNEALGRKLRGLGVVGITHPPVVRLLLELATHGDALDRVVEDGLALCDAGYQGQGRQAVIDRVIGETDIGKAAAFIVTAWVAYVYADRRATGGRPHHPAGARSLEEIPALALIRAAAKDLRLLPGPRPEAYLQAVIRHGEAHEFDRLQSTRRRILHELQGGKAKDAQQLRQGCSTWRHGLGSAVSAQVYLGSDFTAALQQLRQHGAVAIADEKIKITKTGKDTLKAPPAEAPHFPAIDDETGNVAGAEAGRV